MRFAHLQVKSGLKLLSAVAVTGLAVTGCGTLNQGQGEQSASSDAAEMIQVVSSTNVYGSLAEAVGGDRVSVNSLITNTVQDPHSYEASAQDRLMVSRAEVIIRNGGGYDDFLTRLAEGEADQSMIDVVEISGLRSASEEPAEEESHDHDHGADEHGSHDHGEFNEHLWYSIPTMIKLTDALATEFSSKQPKAAEGFAQRAQTLKDELQGLETEVAAIKGNAEGEPIAMTEPVPQYLLEQAGLVDRTPVEFSRAVESESDVPALVLRDATALITDRQVRLLAYNQQTETDQTQQLREAAQNAGVPVVNFTETLPEGEDYVSWMRGNIENLRAALA